MTKQIREALAKATPGPWKWNELRGDYYSDLGAIIGANDNKVCWFGNYETYYPTAGDEPEEPDREIMINAPTWLAQLLDENERLREENGSLRETIKSLRLISKLKRSQEKNPR
jgi:hypothetical protein